MANNDRKEISATIRDVAKAAGVSPATVQDTIQEVVQQEQS